MPKQVLSQTTLSSFWVISKHLQASGKLRLDASSCFSQACVEPSFLNTMSFSFFLTLTQVNNHFPIPMDLLCKKEEQFSRITTIQPDGVFSVPLILAHKAALYLRPAGFGYVQIILKWLGHCLHFVSLAYDLAHRRHHAILIIDFRYLKSVWK